MIDVEWWMVDWQRGRWGELMPMGTSAFRSWMEFRNQRWTSPAQRAKSWAPFKTKRPTASLWLSLQSNRPSANLSISAASGVPVYRAKFDKRARTEAATFFMPALPDMASSHAKPRAFGHSPEA